MTRKLLLITALAGFIISGCNPIDCCDRSVITTDTPTVDIPDGGGDEDITITCPMGWTVIEKPTWVTVNPMSGTGSMEVNISADENDTGKFRSGKVVILADNGDTLTITVKQKAGTMVYVTGWHYDVGAFYGASLWVNGTLHTLPNQVNGFDYAWNNVGNSVFVTDDGTVYVAGIQDFDYNWEVPTLWIDGIPQVFLEEHSYTSGDRGGANSVYVTKEGAVYVAGYIREWDGIGFDCFPPKAILWVNGTKQVLSEYGYAQSVCVGPDGAVYVVGREYNGIYHIAVLWKNGVKQELSGNEGIAKSVCVASDGAVYVAGIDDNCAALWKNGTKQVLSTLPYSMANSVCVAVDGSVYVAGSERPTSSDTAILWRNGTKQVLSYDTWSRAFSVFAAENGAVYVSGTNYNDGTYYESPVLWKNGTRQALPLLLGGGPVAYPLSIFVK